MFILSMGSEDRKHAPNVSIPRSTASINAALSSFPRNKGNRGSGGPPHRIVPTETILPMPYGEFANMGQTIITLFKGWRVSDYGDYKITDLSVASSRCALTTTLDVRAALKPGSLAYLYLHPRFQQPLLLQVQWVRKLDLWTGELFYSMNLSDGLHCAEALYRVDVDANPAHKARRPFARWVLGGDLVRLERYGIEGSRLLVYEMTAKAEGSGGGWRAGKVLGKPVDLGIAHRGVVDVAARKFEGGLEGVFVDPPGVYVEPLD